MEQERKRELEESQAEGRNLVDSRQGGGKEVEGKLERASGVVGKRGGAFQG